MKDQLAIISDLKLRVFIGFQINKQMNDHEFKKDWNAYS